MSEKPGNINKINSFAFIPENRRILEEDSQTTDRPISLYEDLLGINLKDMKGQRILDIGSGQAETFSKQAAELGVEVFSISPDLKQGITTSHKKNGFLKDWQKRSMAGRVQEMPFPSGVFDCEVALFSVPFYMPSIIEEYKKFISEIVRTLKSGGKAYIFPVMKDDNESRFIIQALQQISNEASYQFQNVLGKLDSRLVITKL